MINFSEIHWTPRSGLKTAGGVPASSSRSSQEASDQLRKVSSEKAEISADSRIVLYTEPDSPASDRFRALRMRLHEFRGIAPLRTLLVTSALPQDGKSTVAANLATSLAERGSRRVLLVEGDLHRPTLSQKLGVSARAGLGECLEEGRDPWSAVRRLEPLGWYFLPAGNCKGNPTELVQSESFARVVDQLSGHFDWVIFDSPPLVPLSDAIALSKHVDATVLVVRADTTPVAILKQAVNKIGQKSLLGIILNAAEGLNSLYSTYGSYYSRKTPAAGSKP